ncbi:E3 ubiquitin-protein ligase RHF1A [Cucumispora dikerogammari]|nr:E3 ubiquitin-protein ligase RHF1A [Cucumispora dikerogammari]
MQPLFFLNILYKNETTRVPIKYILNEQPRYQTAVLTTDFNLKTNKYLFCSKDLSSLNELETNNNDTVLGIITNKASKYNQLFKTNHIVTKTQSDNKQSDNPNLSYVKNYANLEKKLNIPIIILEKKYLKFLKKFLKNNNALISIEVINFKKKFSLFMSFLIETPQVMFFGLIFVVMLKIMPMLDRKILMRNALRRNTIRNITIKGESCSICLQEYKIDDIVGETVCKHKYHKECFIGWAERADFCPICKKNIFKKRMSAERRIQAFPFPY